MKKPTVRAVVVAAVSVIVVAGCSGGTSGTGKGGGVSARDSLAAEQQLVTGRYIASTQPIEAGVVREMAGSMPVAAGVSADGKYVVVAGQGYRPALTVVELATGKMVSKLDVPRPRDDRSLGLYRGLLVTADGTGAGVVYAARGAHATVGIYALSANGEIAEAGEIPTRKGDLLAGLAMDGRGVLFVASNSPTSDRAPLDVPGAVIALDTRTKKELSRFEFASPEGTTNYPLAVAVTKDGSRVFVSSQRDNVVYVLDGSDPAKMKLVGKIATGANPVALLMDEGRGRLFVANADSDTVSVVDVGSLKVRKTLLVRPTAAQDLPSASPTGLALAPDGETLLVSLGELNAVAVLDVEDGELEGFIPAGWYPTAVATDGKRVTIVNGKGTTTRYPRAKPLVGSPLNLIEGDVLTRDLPGKVELAGLTEKALDFARVTPADFKEGNPLKGLGIEHVIYVIKENRTYDQLFGALPQGNGNAEYVMFGRDVTPNQHALAERFVLLDNFYDCGDVSGDGWVWSTQAMANEYVTRNMPYGYSGRGRVYDYEGSNNGYPTAGFPAKGPDGKLLSEHPAFAGGAPAVRDVAYSPGGALWDLCKANGKSYRNFGMFLSSAGVVRVADSTTRATQVIVPDNYPSTKGLQPPGHDLDGVTNIDFRRYDLDYADSEAPEMFYKETGNEDFLYSKRTYGKHNSPSRFSEWKREFDLMLKKDPTGRGVPNMMFVRLGNDHTNGLREGKHAPEAMVTDNDFAVGQLVEAVSKSPIWPKTAIFILEDDSQNGPDHVDAHRSICLVISPVVKRATVDSTFHNTVSCIRTMELMLGLPPMNANDAAAKPMMFFSKDAKNSEPFVAIKPDPRIMSKRNPKRTTENVHPKIREMMAESAAMDLEHADKAPAEQLNLILWAAVKGPDSVQPLTPNGPINHAAGNEKDDDDDK